MGQVDDNGAIHEVRIVRTIDPSSADSRVLALEAEMFALPDATETSPGKIYLEPVHRFAEGLYSRELTLPAGCTAVGHRHMQEHMCIIIAGTCLIVTPDGAEEITAPHVRIVAAGTKNAVHAVTECTWVTVHSTELTDVAEIERALVAHEPVANMGLVT